MANELRVRQLAIGGLVEDNPLTAGATTLTSAGVAAVSGGIGSTQHLAIVLDPDGVDGAPEIAYITALTAGAGSATVARGQEGTTARQHVAGTPWVHGATPRDTVRMVTVRRATGSALSLSATAITELAAATNGPGTGGFDLTINAQVGDILEWSFNTISVGSAGATVSIDVYTMVSGSRTNPFGAGLSASNASVLGVSAWFVNNVVNNYAITGAAFYVVQSGDLASGQVTCRPYFAESAASAVQVYSTANLPLTATLKNLGPPSA